MSDYKIVYLIVERGVEPNRQVFWRPAGNAFVCRDGSLNLKLDMYPSLNFNIRDPKPTGGREDAELRPAGEEAGKEDQTSVVTFPNIGNGNKTSGKAPSAKKPAAKPAESNPLGVSNDDIPF
jgi:hypothetical protein